MSTPGLRRVTATLVTGLLLAGCGAPGARNSSGQVTAAATADAFSIAVGDCTGPIPNGSVERLALIPCAEPHAWEAFARTELDGTEYPGARQIQDAADEFCGVEFKAFVGVSLSKSLYQATYLQPTKQTWEDAGDREVLCLVGLASGGIEGSLRGIGT